MKPLCSIISPVLPISIAIFILAGLAAGSFGPCGPNGRYALFYFIGYPIGFIGIFVGIIQTGYRAIDWYNRRDKDGDNNPKV